MTDDEFLRTLEAGTLPEDRFHHADHVHAAWLYLKRFPAREAMWRFSEALRNYAAAKGKPERYHETITWAHLHLLHERLWMTPDAATWAEFAARNADLLDSKESILRRYYRAETLASEPARRMFLMPDLVEY
jgi:hypothetical protein